MQAGMLRAMLVVLALAGAVSARLELDGAKTAGLVGEKPDGYVAAVDPNPSPEVKALVADVNVKRRAAYERIARENGAPLADVAALAGKKLIEGAEKDTWVYVGGRWQRQP
jgi:uncharacterized protein YdbL (DUF1318 family)